jgi:regulator of replication initiation timing
LDSEDDCPNTPDSESVDDSGCAVGDVADPDSDGDGVRDSADSCPGTAGGSVVDSQGCALSQGGDDTGGDTGGGTSGGSSGADDPSLTTMLMMGCIAFIALLALFSRMAASEPTGRASAVSASQNEYKQAQRLQKTLGSTMQENDGLRREREQLTRLLRSSDLTETENRTLRNELSTMQSVMGENDEMAREMVAELEELRGALAEERAAAKEASAEYRDSVHQGDNVGQKVESQTINDADAIARIALESYKQALKDMGKED